MNEPDRRGQAVVTMLLMKHRAELYAYLLAALRNPHDAEDLLQDVSLAASTSWSQYRAGTPFLPWAREIARRRILNFGRKQVRRHALLDPEVLQRLDVAAAEIEEESAPDPRRHALRECMGDLSAPVARMIELRYASRLDVPGVAAGIGRSVQATYAMLKRTKAAIRECVERRLSGAPGHE